MDNRRRKYITGESTQWMLSSVVFPKKILPDVSQDQSELWLIKIFSVHRNRWAVEEMKVQTVQLVSPVGRYYGMDWNFIHYNKEFFHISIYELGDLWYGFIWDECICDLNITYGYSKTYETCFFVLQLYAVIRVFMAPAQDPKPVIVFQAMEVPHAISVRTSHSSLFRLELFLHQNISNSSCWYWLGHANKITNISFFFF